MIPLYYTRAKYAVIPEIVALPPADVDGVEPMHTAFIGKRRDDTGIRSLTTAVPSVTASKVSGRIRWPRPVLPANVSSIWRAHVVAGTDLELVKDVLGMEFAGPVADQLASVGKNYQAVTDALIPFSTHHFDMSHGNSDNDSKTTIRNRLSDELAPLALRIDDIVQQTVGEGNYRVSGSGDGVTYYPTPPNYGSYAFMTVQPSRGGDYLYLHFDPSAKERVSANPIPCSSIPSAQEIPSNWKWKGSFRLSIEVEQLSSTDKDIIKAIRKSFNQLKE